MSRSDVSGPIDLQNVYWGADAFARSLSNADRGFVCLVGLRRCSGK
jgi:hypothetical protein